MIEGSSRGVPRKPRLFLCASYLGIVLVFANFLKQLFGVVIGKWKVLLVRI